jgi:hypothetical protein
MSSCIKNSSLKVAAIVVGISVLMGAHARGANVYVVPPANANTSGTGGTFTLVTTDYTGQGDYGASLLSGLPLGAVIDGLSFRLAPGQSTVTSASSSSNFDISIGPSAFPPGSLSTSTAGNEGPGTVLARSGAITFPANSFVGGANPNPFGPLISFTTPYTYTGGDLLLTFSDAAFSTALVFDAQAGLFSNAEGRQNLGVYNSSTVPQDVDGFALIVQFDYTLASAVPEPSSLTLSGLSVLAGLAYWCFGRRRTRAAAL